MDVAGHDLEIDTPMSPETQVEFITSYLRQQWPGLVVERDRLEVFFYKDQKTKESWDAVGRTDENSDKMVHVIPGDGCITIVHEGLDEQEIRRGNFNSNRCFI